METQNQVSLELQRLAGPDNNFIRTIKDPSVNDILVVSLVILLAIITLVKVVRLRYSVKTVYTVMLLGVIGTAISTLYKIQLMCGTIECYKFGFPHGFYFSNYEGDYFSFIYFFISVLFYSVALWFFYTMCKVFFLALRKK